MPKYITVNGVLRKNPDYQDPNQPQASVKKTSSLPVAHPTAYADPNVALAVVCSPEDMITASEVQMDNNYLPIAQSLSTEVAIDMIQNDSEFLNKYVTAEAVEGSAILDQIGREFAKYETPIGMINRLLMLQDRDLNFIIDDSGSMAANTDVTLQEATSYVRGNRPASSAFLTRWEEVEDRLHIIFDLLAFLPTKSINITFLNSPLIITTKPVASSTPNVIQLNRGERSLEEQKNYLHDVLRNVFTQKVRPSGRTPTYQALKKSFDQTSVPAMHYLFTDGAPSDAMGNVTEAEAQRVSNLIVGRNHPELNPVCLISCTDDDKQTQWMKAVDSHPHTTFVAEVDDFKDECEEVIRKQGLALPYTRGLWILSQLAGPISPHDLDALDENLPLTKSTLDNVLGRQLTPVEYQYYFVRHPSADLYLNEYALFLNKDTVARMPERPKLDEPNLGIIKRSEQERREANAGYRNGERIARPPETRRMEQATQAATHEAMSQLEQIMAQKMAEPPPPAYPGVDQTTQMLSAASIAPHHAFMPPPPPGQQNTSAASAPNNSFSI